MWKLSQALTGPDPSHVNLPMVVQIEEGNPTQCAAALAKHRDVKTVSPPTWGGGSPNLPQARNSTNIQKLPHFYLEPSIQRPLAKGQAPPTTRAD